MGNKIRNDPKFYRSRSDLARNIKAADQQVDKVAPSEDRTIGATIDSRWYIRLRPLPIVHSGD
jgi:hypothetical protein